MGRRSQSSKGTIFLNSALLLGKPLYISVNRNYNQEQEQFPCIIDMLHNLDKLQKLTISDDL